jgi:hypothetical protein
MWRLQSKESSLSVKTEPLQDVNRIRKRMLDYGIDKNKVEQMKADREDLGAFDPASKSFDMDTKNVHVDHNHALNRGGTEGTFAECCAPGEAAL